MKKVFQEKDSDSNENITDKLFGNRRKHTEVKQLGPGLALGWVTIQVLDVDAVATNTVKIPEVEKRGLHCKLLGQKKCFQKLPIASSSLFFFSLCSLSIFSFAYFLTRALLNALLL